MNVYVVNTGIITAIGDNTSACLNSLLSGETGVGKAEHLESFWNNDLPIAEVKKSNKELAELTGVDPTWPRTALLSAIAVQELLTGYDFTGLRLGMFSANTVGGMDLTERVYSSFIRGGEVDFKNIENHECGSVTELVAEHFGITDFVTTISTACSSSANSIMMASQMIENGMLDVAIAGGADSMSKFTLNGFNTLMILDKQPCQPFDNNRRGLNLGEGAGYILLMSEHAAEKCNTKKICRLSGYSNANDAFHQTASSPEGIGNKLAMVNAMKKAGVSPSDIDYINLHGTGTANNDSSEGKAVQAIFENSVPSASSTKGYTGHTLGAAGGVEAVFSTLAIQHRVIFPNLRWETQMEDINWSVNTSLQEGKEINHVLSNSFGFGGNCSSLVLSKS